MTMSDNAAISRKHSIDILGVDVSGTGLGVFTSGGDSQGMNSALRAVVRSALYLGCKVFLIKEGYQGMVNGGNNFQQAEWKDVSGIIHLGGTVIGSACSEEFRHRSGRLRAALNLVKHSINNLVVIGGNDSLTGANLFREEWSSLLQELHSKGLVMMEEMEKCQNLSIVGIVGTIHNDFCGTDMAIGTDSALHRIVYAIDAIIPTASSHKRTFIMEVMGRHCGYLALLSAIATEADFLFIPEQPPEVNWPQILTDKLKKTWKMGQRLNIIIVSEGAIDQEGMKITAEDVRNAVVEQTHHDTRVTVLGYIQRGGAPTAFDRTLGCRMGVEAVLSVLKAQPKSPANVVALSRNAIVLLPLMECVNLTQSIEKARAEKNWPRVLKLRGSVFESYMEVYQRLNKYQSSSLASSEDHASATINLAIMNIGAPTCGMNAAVNSFVRSSLIAGNTAFAIQNGITGLVEGNLEIMDWKSVNGWVTEGGSRLGTNRILPEGRFNEIAEQIRKFNIQGLAIVGGFEAFQSCLQLYQQRHIYPEFQIPIVVIPATISNNVPGTELSLGADTALNVISQICDKLHQSASGSDKRVFIVETQGGSCGYLATMAGLAGGCDAAYIREEKYGIDQLKKDLKRLTDKIGIGHQANGLLLCCEKADENYDIDYLHRLYEGEGKGIFSVRANVIGHMQQGSSPSVFDRSFSIKMAARAHQWLLQQVENRNNNGRESACVIGLQQSVYKFTSVEELSLEADFEHRVWNKAWWMPLRGILKILSKDEAIYHPEAICISLEKLKLKRL